MSNEKSIALSLSNIDLPNYAGNTNIYSSNIVRPLMSFDVPNNLRSIVQNLNKAINRVFSSLNKILSNSKGE